MKNFIAIVTFLCSNFSFTQNSIAIIDSLKNEARKNIPDSTRAQLYGDISWQYNSVSIDSAIVYGENALSIARTLKNDRLIAQCLNDLGASYFLQMELDKALALYNESKEIRIQLKDEAGIAALDVKLGGLFLKKSMYEKALDHYLSALKYYESINNEAYIATVQGQIATVHASLKNYDKAIEYLAKVEKYFSQNPAYSYQRANNLVRMGGIYLSMGDTNKSITTYNDALVVAKETQNTFVISAANVNLGSIYTAQKNHTLALQYLLTSYQVSTENRLVSDNINSSINLGVNYNYLHQFSTAKKYLLHAVQQLDPHQASELLGKAYLNLIPVYAVEKKTDSIFYYMDAYTDNQNKILSNEIVSAVAEMETKYDTEKKEQTIFLLDAKNKAQALKTTVLILLFGFTFIMGIIGFYIWQLQQKNKQKALIAEKEIALQKAVLEAEEKERTRLAQELHDGVAQLLVAAKMNLSRNSENTNTVEMVDDAIVEIRNISHVMMPQVLLQFGLFKAIENLTTKISNKNSLLLHIDCSGDDTQLKQDQKINIYRIVQELVSNGIKHAEATEITIDLSVFEDEISIIVSDNGKGFDNSKPTKNGIGLENIRTRVAFLGGQLHIESAPQQGSSFIIQI